MNGDGAGNADGLPKPVSALVTPLLTDMYEITMAYAYWKERRHEDPSIFELHFRKEPFHGAFAIFAGIDEVLKHLANFRFKDCDIAYLRTQLPHADEGFFEWLGGLDCSHVKVYALQNGTVCFAHETLIRVEGPLGIAQLLETTILNLVNYATLIATNAARFRLAAGPDKVLVEFGLRRAQGPDGGMTASKYSYLGGFDGTSNVQAGKMFGIKISGTHAHSFVQSYTSLDDLPNPMLDGFDMVAAALKYRDNLGFTESNLGELAAFIAYAQSWPDNFLALIDTYDTLRSGVPNFIVVALALLDAGHEPVGIRLDSGDLSYLSRRTRMWFDKIAATEKREAFKRFKIVASNDINEDVLHSLTKQGHAIDMFGVGTHLVTCQAQPALGCVYKLVQIRDKPRIKLSNEVSKVSIPCRKYLYRLKSASGEALVDLMTLDSQPPPVPGERLLCRHPFEPQRRAYVTPQGVESLLNLLWDGGNGGLQPGALITLEEARTRAQEQLNGIREDTLRFLNPTPYKVSLTEGLFQFFHQLWEAEAPIGQL